MEADLKFPGMTVNVDAMPFVPTDMVSKVYINAFVYSKHVQDRLAAVDPKKQPENKVKRNSYDLISCQSIKIRNMDQ